MSSLKPTILRLFIFMPLLATVAVIIRLQARLARQVKFGADNYLIIRAVVFCYGLSAVTITAAELGNLGGHLVFGPNFVPINGEEFRLFQQTLWVLSFVSIPLLGLTKLSVLFFYKRIVVSRTFILVAWAVIGLEIPWTISLFFVNLLDCVSIELNWHDYAGATGKCIDIAKIFWVVIIIDILTDALILAIPGPQILELQMTTTRKLQIIAIFGLGFFVVGAGIARTVLSAPGATIQATELDYTYSRAPAVYWLVVEANVAVISAYLPIFQPRVLAIKLSGLGNSLQRVVSWRSRGSSATVSRVSSQKNSPLFNKQGIDQSYQSHTTIESLPRRPTLQHDQPGLGSPRNFLELIT
ncbi:hypothetical protein F4860DRAFT_499994 [Xylaria cubensis]|nr:hypothetical protein F4860DRAFT_499994 [Xylaria cubensis]